MNAFRFDLARAPVKKAAWMTADDGQQSGSSGDLLCTSSDSVGATTVKQKLTTAVGMGHAFEVLRRRFLPVVQLRCAKRRRTAATSSSSPPFTTNALVSAIRRSRAAIAQWSVPMLRRLCEACEVSVADSGAVLIYEAEPHTSCGLVIVVAGEVVEERRDGNEGGHVKWRAPVVLEEDVVLSESCARLLVRASSRVAFARIRSDVLLEAVASKEFESWEGYAEFKSSVATVRSRALGNEFFPTSIHVKQCWLLRNLSGEDADFVTQCMSPLVCARDELIVQQGAAPSVSGVYLVCRGTIDVRRDGRKVCTLGPGSTFGEMSFILGDRWSFSAVVTSSFADLWVLSGKRWLLNLSPSHEAVLGQSLAELALHSRVQWWKTSLQNCSATSAPEWIRRLRHVPTLCHCTESALAELVRLASPKVFQPKTIVCSKGSVCDSLCIVCSGTVHAVTSPPTEPTCPPTFRQAAHSDGDDSDDAPLQYFGEYCFEAHTWWYDIVAETTVDVLRLPVAVLQVVLQRRQLLAQAVDIASQGCAMLRMQCGSPAAAASDASGAPATIPRGRRLSGQNRLSPAAAAASEATHTIARGPSLGTDDVPCTAAEVFTAWKAARQRVLETVLPSQSSGLLRKENRSKELRVRERLSLAWRHARTRVVLGEAVSTTTTATSARLWEFGNVAQAIGPRAILVERLLSAPSRLLTPIARVIARYGWDRWLADNRAAALSGAEPSQEPPSEPALVSKSSMMSSSTVALPPAVLEVLNDSEIPPSLVGDERGSSGSGPCSRSEWHRSPTPERAKMDVTLHATPPTLPMPISSEAVHRVREHALPPTPTHHSPDRPQTAGSGKPAVAFVRTHDLTRPITTGSIATATLSVSPDRHSESDSTHITTSTTMLSPVPPPQNSYHAFANPEEPNGLVDRLSTTAATTATIVSTSVRPFQRDVSVRPSSATPGQQPRGLRPFSAQARQPSPLTRMVHMTGPQESSPHLLKSIESVQADAFWNEVEEDNSDDVDCVLVGEELVHETNTAARTSGALSRRTKAVVLLMHVVSCSDLEGCDSVVEPVVKLVGASSGRVFMTTPAMRNTSNPVWSIDEASFITVLLSREDIRVLVCENHSEDLGEHSADVLYAARIATSALGNHNGAGLRTLPLAPTSSHRHCGPSSAKVCLRMMLTSPHQDAALSGENRRLGWRDHPDSDQTSYSRGEVGDVTSTIGGARANGRETNVIVLTVCDCSFREPNSRALPRDRQYVAELSTNNGESGPCESSPTLLLRTPPSYPDSRKANVARWMCERSSCHFECEGGLLTFSLIASGGNGSSPAALNSNVVVANVTVTADELTFGGPGSRALEVRGVPSAAPPLLGGAVVADLHVHVWFAGTANDEHLQRTADVDVTLVYVKSFDIRASRLDLPWLPDPIVRLALLQSPNPSAITPTTVMHSPVVLSDVGATWPFSAASTLVTSGDEMCSTKLLATVKDNSDGATLGEATITLSKRRDSFADCVFPLSDEKGNLTISAIPLTVFRMGSAAKYLAWEQRLPPVLVVYVRECRDLQAPLGNDNAQHPLDPHVTVRFAGQKVPLLRTTAVSQSRDPRWALEGATFGVDLASWDATSAASSSGLSGSSAHGVALRFDVWDSSEAPRDSVGYANVPIVELVKRPGEHVVPLSTGTTHTSDGLERQRGQKDCDTGLDDAEDEEAGVVGAQRALSRVASRPLGVLVVECIVRRPDVSDQGYDHTETTVAALALVEDDVPRHAVADRALSPSPPRLPTVLGGSPHRPPTHRPAAALKKCLTVHVYLGACHNLPLQPGCPFLLAQQQGTVLCTTSVALRGDAQHPWWMPQDATADVVLEFAHDRFVDEGALQISCMWQHGMSVVEIGHATIQVGSALNAGVYLGADLQSGSTTAQKVMMQTMELRGGACDAAAASTGLRPTLTLMLRHDAVVL